jgi:hypothetical protein
MYCSEWCNAGEGKPGLHWGCGGGTDGDYTCDCAGCNGCPNPNQCEDGRPNAARGGNYCSEWCNTPDVWDCGTPSDPNTKYQCSCSGCNGCVDGVAGIPTCGTDVGGTNYCDTWCNTEGKWDCGIGYDDNAGVPGGYRCDCKQCNGCGTGANKWVSLTDVSWDELYRLHPYKTTGELDTQLTLQPQGYEYGIPAIQAWSGYETTALPSGYTCVCAGGETMGAWGDCGVGVQSGTHNSESNFLCGFGPGKPGLDILPVKVSSYCGDDGSSDLDAVGTGTWDCDTPNQYCIDYSHYMPDRQAYICQHVDEECVKSKKYKIGKCGKTSVQLANEMQA